LELPLTQVAQAQQQAMYRQTTLDCLARVAQAGNRLCASKLPWSCLTRVAQAQQQAMCKPGYLGLPHTDKLKKHSKQFMCTSKLPRLPHTGASNHNGRAMYNQLPWFLPCCTAQQQTMYQPGYWSCLTRVAQPATGYVPAGLLGLPHPRRLQHQRSCVPARYPARAMPDEAQAWLTQAMYQQLAQSCLTRVAQAQQRAMYQQATLELPHTGQLKRNRLSCQQATLSCLTRVAQSTATGYVPADYWACLTRSASSEAQQQAMYQPGCGPAPRVGSSTATGYVAGYLGLPHTVAQAQQQAVCQQAVGCLTQTAQAHKQAMCQQATLSCLTRAAQLKTMHQHAGTETPHGSAQTDNRLCTSRANGLPHADQLKRSNGLMYRADCLG
jgi:hypothetical protein